MNRSFYQLLYQITPIFLTNGIATNIGGKIIPIMALLNPNAYNILFSGGNGDFNMDSYFGIFQPASGGSLVAQQIAEYPFASLNVAANATVKQPIELSMIMVTPMKTEYAWAVKNATMTALKAALDTHNNMGGTYTVFTPAFTYYDMIMLNLSDMSNPQIALPQNTWKWDFRKPLVSQTDLVSAENNLYSKITGGIQTSTEWTNALTALGLPASSVNAAAGSGGTAPFAPPVTIGGLVPLSPLSQ
jgi:hypothetical protein